MTFEDAALLDPDTDPGDVVNGEWVPVSKNTWRHGKLVFNVCMVLGVYVRQHPGWSVAAGDPGAKLRSNPDTLRGPDVAIARQERDPTGRGKEGWLEGAPDVAIEIVGDGQSVTELLQKALEYLAAGGKMVWILDPDPQRLVLVTPPNGIRILNADDVIEGGEALPEFSCKVGELFA
jgi:Uma2 family endonuclease